MSSYEKRGVSAGKEEVHAAISKLDKGLVPNAFCKILPDLAANDPDWCNVMHADTAGTKTSLAYLYWKETGDLNAWKGIVQDAIVMNLDDMACAGFTDNIILSSTIGRNKNRVPGEVLKALIEGTSEFIEKMHSLGVNITLAGGETADVGDIVRTADVGFTAFARIRRNEVVNIDIKPGDVVVGFESCGQASYEGEYNSGIGSNGLSFARHEALTNDYARKYPESFDPELDPDYVYSGKYNVTDQYQSYKIGKLLLSPTRTFVPLIKAILDQHRSEIHGIIHNTGGGQTKALHFIRNLHIIKDNPLPVPPVFELIRNIRNTPWQEMYKVFNMGQRLEIYTDKPTADRLIELGKTFNIKGQITGRVEKYEGKKVTIHTASGEILEY
jgi:phosphoribosylformylglycinamidine cyclo-ligase